MKKLTTLASILLMIGFMTYIVGLQADIIAKNRKILEDVQYQVRRLNYGKNNFVMDNDANQKNR